MKTFLRLGAFGFLSWLVVFLASVCLFFLKKENERLFEMLMSFVLTGCAVALTTIYFRKVRGGFLRAGILLGCAFVCANILCDLPMFSFGPMEMPLSRYFAEIGLAYLIMPIISIGYGYALKQAMCAARGRPD